MEYNYLKVSFEVKRRLGGDAAFTLAYLDFISKKLKRDDQGYFCLDASFAARGLAINGKKFRRDRDKLVEAGYIEYIPGANQNVKPRYKLL